MTQAAMQDAHAMGVLADAIRDTDLTGGIFLLTKLWRDGYEQGLKAGQVADNGELRKGE